MGVEADGGIVYRRLIKEPVKKNAHAKAEVPPTASPATEKRTIEAEGGAAAKNPKTEDGAAAKMQMNFKLSSKTIVDKWGNAWAVEEDIVEQPAGRRRANQPNWNGDSLSDASLPSGI